ncbi:MAG TPA: aldehyde dehydrogenase family protein [Ignavibacteriaceae bacterium]|nr:aldehyde dehydrogenase family protein [Ignavibacteriaceae bacterium]
MLTSMNPANNKTIKSYTEMQGEEISQIISQADEAFNSWKETSFIHRTKLMHNAASVLRNNSEEYSLLMTTEMGKPIKQSRAEVEKCAWVCDYYADNAEKFLRDEIIKTEASKSFVSYQPLGVILAVMPWNFPFWQVLRFAAPNIMAGNAGLLKHASNVSGCALAIEDIFRKAGFPENLFRTLLVSSKNTSQVISHKKVQAVTLTGSVPAGKAVASLSGSLIKKTVLELGGSDPYIILEDADLEQAAISCVTSRLINAGQSCIAAKRFIIVESVYDQFEKLFIDFMSKKKMGDPLDEKNDLGPQTSYN